jgi:outer membrane protein assembly factor BamB
MRHLTLTASFWFLALACRADGVPADRAEHWHRWRGPEATGVATLGTPPTTWDEATNIQWKVEIPGSGSGSTVVWGDRIYLLTAIKTDRTAAAEVAGQKRRTPSPFRLVQNETPASEPQLRPRRGEGRPPGGEGRRRGGRRGGRGGRREPVTNFYQFVVLCIDRHTGEILWQKQAAEVVPHEGHHSTASFASASPVTDGKNLYVSFGSRGVYSYDMEGNLRWKRDLGKFNTRNSFGEGASPELYGDTLVVNCDHEGQSFIIALDANTGDTRWKQLRDEETSWGTPFITEHDGVVQVIINAMNRARSYDLKTGEVLWECGGQAQGPVPTAVRHKDLVYCMTGHRGSALYAIPLAARGDITDSEEIAWTRDRDTPYVSSPLLYDNQLYFLKSNNAILTCLDAVTGEPIFRGKRLPGMDTIYASPVGAAGRVYIAGRNGKTIVIEHGAEFTVLAENQLDEPIDATPAIVGDSIYIRGSKHLYRVAEK